MHDKEEWRTWQAITNFNKMAPRFKLGELTWSQYLDSFNSRAKANPGVPEPNLKLAMYNSLEAEAFKLASPDYNPCEATYKTVSFREYAARLGQLFEPESDTESARLEFDLRVQQMGEQPAFYYRDKLNLFEKAYRAELRDYHFFYEKCIQGLINHEMRYQLRLQLPKPINNTAQFRETLVHIATVVRRRYLAKDINEAEAMGAETYTTTHSYRAQTNHPWSQVKQEPVNEIRTGRESEDRACFHCQAKGHLVAQCPRKAAGLPATIQAPKQPFAQRQPFARRQPPASQQPPASRQPPSATQRTKPTTGRFGFRKGQTRPARHQSWRDSKGRVMVVYENEDEESEFDILQEDEWANTGLGDVPHIDEFRSDYEPSTFLEDHQ